MNAPDSWTVPVATPQWIDGVPHDPESGDIYFSRADGRAESECVFLHGNHLQERWRALDAERSGVFVLGETGFGSGLNFLLACQWFERFAPPSWRLHYLSAEYRPWPLSDLQRAHANWPDLHRYATALQEIWPCPLRAAHRSHPLPGRVTLTLLLDDAHNAFSSIDAKVDAWFLDGFAPAKNQALWTNDLFQQIARLSHPGATFGTYTAAGAVRAALANAGFEVQRLPGFAGKRHRLGGSFQGESSATPLRHPKRAAIIGAGFAGCSMARSLAERGLQVSVFEAASTPAAGASGVPAAVQYLKLSGACSPVARLQLQSSLLTSSLIKRRYSGARQTGVLQMAMSEDQWQRWQALEAAPEELLQLKDPQQAESISGLPTQHGALWFPNAHTVAGAQWCTDLLDHPAICLHSDCTILRTSNKPAGTWTLHTAGETFAGFDLVVHCTGIGTQAATTQTPHGLTLRPVRGQLSRVRLPASAPDCVVTGHGHVVPAGAQAVWVGSSYLHDQTSLQPSAEEDEENLHKAREILRQADHSALEVIENWVGTRCAGPDHLPIAGALPGQTGEYACTGLRSRGLLLTPLLAEYIADLACGEPVALYREQREMLQVRAPRQKKA